MSIGPTGLFCDRRSSTALRNKGMAEQRNVNSLIGVNTICGGGCLRQKVAKIS